MDSVGSESQTVAQQQYDAVFMSRDHEFEHTSKSIFCLFTVSMTSVLGLHTNI